MPVRLDRLRTWRLASVWLCAVCALGAPATRAVAADGALDARIAELEAAVQRDPENLYTSADYRQLVIASGDFDRSIRLFEKLARRPATGPNVHISLGLAYVDKVPVSGELRRLYLGRDAIAEATRAIDREPSVLAYYMRGRINLYFNNLIFHRSALGIQDLQKALTLITQQTPAAIAANVYASLGDGYWWRFDDRQAARDVWRRGAERYPDDALLKARLSTDDALVANVVWKALLPGTRVDTTLRSGRR